MGKTWKDRHRLKNDFKKKRCFACGRDVKKPTDKIFCSDVCKRNCLRDPYTPGNRAAIRILGLPTKQTSPADGGRARLERVLNDTPPSAEIAGGAAAQIRDLTSLGTKSRRSPENQGGQHE